jgi:hypothetical protein
VALRQIFDLYCCVRPCRYYAGTPSPHKRPQDLDVIVYRENTEDIYMGIEWEANDPVCLELIKHLNTVVIPANGKLGKRQIPAGSGIGIKPVSKAGSQRHIRKAIQHALRAGGRQAPRDPGAQGQHHEIHRGLLPRLGLRAGHQRIPGRLRDRAGELDPRQRSTATRA